MLLAEILVLKGMPIICLFPISLLRTLISWIFVSYFNILLFFSGTVEAYAKKMREEDENTELAPVYYTMTKLLARVK